MRLNLFSAAVLAFASSAAHGQSQAVQWRVKDGGNGHWYAGVRSPTPLTWEAAREAAEQRGGLLATLTSSAENAFVLSVIIDRSELWQNNGFGGPWLGAFQPDPQSPPDAGWTWVTGETWSYTNWAGGEPNDGGWQGGRESYLIVYTSGHWNDFTNDGPENAKYSYVIEWSADCNNDGVVDYGQCRDGSLPDYNGNNIPDCCEAGTPCEAGRYPVQWSTADGGNGHWYHLKDRAPGRDWLGWSMSANSHGGHLVTLTSVGENQFVASPRVWGSSPLSLPAAHAFIGLQQPSGSMEPSGGWRWVTDEPFQFDPSQWGSLEDCCPGSPYCGGEGEDAAAMWSWIGDEQAPGVAGKWNDVGKCLDKWGAIIEWSADCNNDGIVDYGQILSGQLVDANSNGVPDTCECFADVNNSGAVNGVDLAIVLGAWGTSGQADGDADINDDGIVNGQDLAFVLGSWGPCP